MDRDDNDQVTWRDILHLQKQIQELDSRISMVETHITWIKTKLNNISRDVSSLRWWIIGSIVGGMAVVFLFRVLIGLL